MNVSVMVNPADQARVDSYLASIPGGIEKALNRANRRVAAGGITLISKSIRDQINIKKKDVDGVIAHRPLAKEAYVLTLRKSKRLPLKYFGARQTKKGVAYRIRKGGGVSKIASGFGPDIPQFHGHVAVRRTKKRYPLRYPKGASPMGVFLKNNNLKTIVPELQRRLTDRIIHEVNYILRVGGKSQGFDI